MKTNQWYQEKIIESIYLVGHGNEIKEGENAQDYWKDYFQLKDVFKPIFNLISPLTGVWDTFAIDYVINGSVEKTIQKTNLEFENWLIETMIRKNAKFEDTFEYGQTELKIKGKGAYEYIVKML